MTHGRQELALDEISRLGRLPCRPQGQLVALLGGQIHQSPDGLVGLGGGDLAADHEPAEGPVFAPQLDLPLAESRLLQRVIKGLVRCVGVLHRSIEHGRVLADQLGSPVAGHHQ
jgi:hypothetical protein